MEIKMQFLNIWPFLEIGGDSLLITSQSIGILDGLGWEAYHICLGINQLYKLVKPARDKRIP